MRIPVIRGLIDRRVLVNFAIDPEVMARALPPPFAPKLHGGAAIGGICLIRLKDIRPRRLPRALGIASENAAHRIAVTWEQDGERREGVYIPRRDTSSRLNALVGGRLFPGVHHHARFEVEEADDRYRIAMTSDDGGAHVSVSGRVVDELPEGSVFESLEAASRFFEQGSLGYSDSGRPGEYDGLELRTATWRVAPLAVDAVASSYFDDRARFPEGTVRFDDALLMRGIEHEWRGRASLCQSPEAAATSAPLPGL